MMQQQQALIYTRHTSANRRAVPPQTHYYSNQTDVEDNSKTKI